MAVHGAILDLGHELAARLVGLGRQHKAARIAIESVHDTEAVGLFSLHVAEVLLPAVPDERIHERAVGMIDRRVAHEPHLLRQHEHVLVLVADIQIDGLTVDHDGLRLVVHLVDHGIARGYGLLLGHRGAIHEHAALLDGPGRRRARGIEPAGGAEGIEARAGVVGRHDMAERSGHATRPPPAWRMRRMRPWRPGPSPRCARPTAFPGRTARTRRSHQYRPH